MWKVCMYVRAVTCRIVLVSMTIQFTEASVACLCIMCAYVWTAMLAASPDAKATPTKESFFNRDGLPPALSREGSENAKDSRLRGFRQSRR